MAEQGTHAELLEQRVLVEVLDAGGVLTDDEGGEVLDGAGSRDPATPGRSEG